jgi:hypothetical protein
MVEWIWRTTLDRSGRPPALPVEVSSPQGRTSPSVVIVASAKSLALDLGLEAVGCQPAKTARAGEGRGGKRRKSARPAFDYV